MHPASGHLWQYVSLADSNFSGFFIENKGALPLYYILFNDIEANTAQINKNIRVVTLEIKLVRKHLLKVKDAVSNQIAKSGCVPLYGRFRLLCCKNL